MLEGTAKTQPILASVAWHGAGVASPVCLPTDPTNQAGTCQERASSSHPQRVFLSNLLPATHQLWGSVSRLQDWLNYLMMGETLLLRLGLAALVSKCRLWGNAGSMTRARLLSCKTETSGRFSPGEGEAETWLHGAKVAWLVEWEHWGKQCLAFLCILTKKPQHEFKTRQYPEVSVQISQISKERHVPSGIYPYITPQRFWIPQENALEAAVKYFLD